MVAEQARSYSDTPEQLPPQLQSPEDVFKLLQIQYSRYPLFKAGHPGYSAIFVRDIVKSGRAARNPMMLAGIIALGGDLQAKNKDPIRGAYPGAIFHEYNPERGDGIDINGRGNTMFNACDTTAEWTIGHEDYTRLTGDYSFVRRYRSELDAASRYISDHVNSNGLFIEDPEFSGAKHFALKVTTWRDSVLPGRGTGEATYPVVYPLAHAQNIAALRSFSRLTGAEWPRKLAQRMVEALPDLYSPRTRSFFIAKDADGPIEGVNSDNLHMLAYLEPGDLPPDIVESLVSASEILETDWGYRPLEPELAKKTNDPYHTDPVWPHEQSATHTGIKAHLDWAIKEKLKGLIGALEHAFEVTGRPNNYYDKNPGSYPETILNGMPWGNKIQLWSAAARKEYSLSA